MTNLFRTLLFLFVLLLIIGGQTYAYASPQNSHTSVESIENEINAIRNYQVKLTTKIFPPSNPKFPDNFDPNRYMEVISEVSGETGKNMKIVTHMENQEIGSETEHTLVYDGTWLWVQQKVISFPNMELESPMVSAIKIHIPTVSPDPVNEPFNALYGINGIGLFPNKDLPGTLLELLGTYNFEKIMGKNEPQFSGLKINNGEEKNEESTEIEKELKDFMTESTRFSKIWVSDKSKLINEYLIGKSADRPTLHTKIDYLKVNKVLPENIFAYSPPDNVVVQDMTSSILEKTGAGKK